MTAEYAMMQETLSKVVEQLPERRRAVFELCFLKEFTYRETAEVLGISIKTVENQMGAALKTLRAAFQRFADA
jgi:RNA polymerase sigma-70 factor (ECF subfamily)